MEGPRAPKADEFQNLVQFLDTNLRPQHEWSVAEEYPTAVSPKNLHNFRIITEKEKILSHAVIRPTIVKTNRGLFKIGCIGSVVTDEAYRNQGLSQSVMKDCVQNVVEQGCDIAMLWTNLYDFYRKLGFELAGTEVSLVFDHPFPTNHGKTFKIIEGNRVDPQAILRLYMQHTVASIRTLDEIEKYLKIPNSRVYTAWDGEGRMVGYAIEGKGADLTGYVHEWGGMVEPLLSLFSYIRQTQNKPLTVIVPQHSQNLIRSADKVGARRVDGFLGMVKIANHNAVYGKIIRSARQEFGVNNLIFEKRGEETFFGIGDNIFKTNDDRDMIRLIFGPSKPSALHDYGTELNSLFDKLFPLDLWVWGWESV